MNAFWIPKPPKTDPSDDVDPLYDLVGAPFLAAVPHGTKADNNALQPMLLWFAEDGYESPQGTRCGVTYEEIVFVARVPEIPKV